MASRRQRRRIGDKKKKKKKIRAATTIKKKIVKTKESAPAPQAVQPKSSAARTGSRETTVGDVVKEKNHDERRRRDKRTCAVCGEGKTHDNEPFCPYNYIHGLFGLGTCMERCHPGIHPLLLASDSDSGSHHQLRRLVRVTNAPLCAIPGNHELKWLFRRFGPLVGCNLARLTLDDRVGFGWVAFQSRQHAEEAINELNGHLLGDRRLRVDWFYPRT